MHTRLTNWDNILSISDTGIHYLFWFDMAISIILSDTIHDFKTHCLCHNIYIYTNYPARVNDCL